jgi:type VI secretion system protein ImpA
LPNRSLLPNGRLLSPDDLLKPIPGDRPAGTDLLYDDVVAAMRDAVKLDRGSAKPTDTAQVIRLASDVLANRSKDLTIAAWLTTALLYREGFAGLRAGLALMRGLIERYWVDVYPAIRGKDLDDRVNSIELVSDRLDRAVRETAVTPVGHSFADYVRSRSIGYEHVVEYDLPKKALRQKALEDSRVVTPEAFDAGAETGEKEWYQGLLSHLDGCLKELDLLDQADREKFGDQAPRSTRVRKALKEVRGVAERLLEQRLQRERDLLTPPTPPQTAMQDVPTPPVEKAPPPAAMRDAPVAHNATEAGSTPTKISDSGVNPEVELSNQSGKSNGGEALARGPRASSPDVLSSAEVAVASVVEAARYLRSADPQNPVPYLLLRALRWGELRAAGSELGRLLEAPPTSVRKRLEGYLLDGEWEMLLDGAEAAMSLPYGRGWLDLQYYTTKACENLGAGYKTVAGAVRSSLLALLSDLPRLEKKELVDDTPTAGADALKWLSTAIVGGARTPVAVSKNGGDPAASSTLELAAVEARAGRHQRAAELLLCEPLGEESKRARFIRRLQLAELMMSTERQGVAKSLLEGLVAQLETPHRIDEWEAGTWAAQPIALLCRCIDALEANAPARSELYRRLYALDPVQAIELTPD